MNKHFVIATVCSFSLLTSASLAAFPKSKVSESQHLFAQSIIYHSLSGFCTNVAGNKSLSSDYQKWRVSYQDSIKQGRIEVADLAATMDKTMDSVVSDLVHVAEQEWGQMDSSQRQQKCQDLQAFLNQTKPEKPATY
ncbi:hypothetical protein [Agarivorans sp. 1_MG-2023]|uniref:hypothetical protein n=1 Tax=Agarivorans sp. 1_MG-2023 TaxID=3062634 RepID=UPI0026E48388|nr:hypothetical protein [Agarivorans sp. 1_MG-2023]MDO6762630.1 hypothetical protein [Agarivorans sp. 1_MG-2023]